MAAFASVLTTSALRVASLDLCADEYLLAVAQDREIAAVSRLAHEPSEFASAARARRFPAYRGRIETLIPLKPDLLVTVGGPGGRSTVALAAKLGWRILTLPPPQTPADVAANLDRMARALGHPARIHAWKSRLAAVERAVPPARDAIFLGGGGLSVSPDGLSAQWMRLAGLRQRAVPGGRVTLEGLASRPPAVLLRSDYRSGQLSLGQRWLSHPLVRSTPARMIRTDGRVWTCGGPMMLAEIERLRSIR